MKKYLTDLAYTHVQKRFVHRLLRHILSTFLINVYESAVDFKTIKALSREFCAAIQDLTILMWE